MTGPIRLSMSMSLDGFIAGPDDRPGQELGRGGGRRLFAATGAEPVELQPIRRLEGRDATHLRSRVVHRPRTGRDDSGRVGGPPPDSVSTLFR